MERTETQIKILEIGKKEFLEKGFKDASLNKIVAEAGFTKGAFYGYYPVSYTHLDVYKRQAQSRSMSPLCHAQSTKRVFTASATCRRERVAGSAVRR